MIKSGLIGLMNRSSKNSFNDSGIITLILGTYVNLVERSSSSSSPGAPGPSFIKPKFDSNPLHRPQGKDF